MKSARRLENPEICMQFAIKMTLNLFNAGWSLTEGSLSAVVWGGGLRDAMWQDYAMVHHYNLNCIIILQKKIIRIIAKVS